MLTFATLLAGPLAGPECRRAVARGWVVLVRALAAAAFFSVVLAAVWWWWVVLQTDPGHMPYYELRLALSAVLFMLLTVALVQGPAVLAGSLAGERQRGVLALLLTTRVSSREIVTGRLLGKLSQVVMVLLAGVPALVLLGSLAGYGLAWVGLTVLLPSAVAWGGGGLAVAASTLCKRGRDALLAVYLVALVLVVGPAALSGSVPWPLDGPVEAINPFACVVPLTWEDRLGPGLWTVAVWTAVGFAGVAVASWRVRPASESDTSGARPTRRGLRGFGVPPVNERRPMLWKEMYIERVATLGRFGRWAFQLLAAALCIGSVGLAAVMLVSLYWRADVETADWARGQLAGWVGGTGAFLAYLIEWAIGLRAAVSISSERERGTWDGLLTSPLEAGEIVRGKLWGSLHALRFLILAALTSWWVAAVTEAIPLALAARWTVEVLVVGAFMAAVGVRASLASETATRAMSMTIGVWLGSVVGVAILTFITLATFVLVANSVWIAFTFLGLVPPLTTLWMPVRGSVAWPLASNLLYLGFTLSVVSESRLRFDRLAGRMVEGGASLAVERMFYDKPTAPVLADGSDLPTPPATTPSAAQRAEEPVSDPA